MRKACIVFLVILLLTSSAGCLSSSAQTPSSSPVSNSSTGTSSHFEQTKRETSSVHASIRVSIVTSPINGTFSGNLTAPAEIFGDVEKFLEEMNATLYSFEARIIGNESNSSITVYVLKLVPPFIPKDFEVTINAHPINGTTFVPYAWTIPVFVEFGNVTTTSYLKVSSGNVIKGTGNLMESELDNLNGSTILTINGLRFVVLVSKPGSYIFAVFHNDTEISSGGMEVGR
ncbi:hypothetical protein [Thermococcus sp.]|uniref:hypothetical protein n=1 Tax=Thermococcus sp. TaxID=35749 RepID=UPI00263643C3|nr:hypothetical protein [Thermococcus sp.]